jgi:D-3-phosphoglycerate dehydrogenase
VPVVAGLWENFDRAADFRSAQAYLAQMGIEYVNHKAEPRKEYEKSITMELTAEVDADNLRRVSVRGTVAEGVLMVSRINEFDRLYFQPFGHTVFFLYDDRPGVLAAIGTKLAGAGINIEDTRNPHDPKTNRSLAIMKINKPAGEDLMAGIKKEIRALAAFHIQL